MVANPRANGGNARAKHLSKEQRSAIAKKAAQARWTESLPQVLCGSVETPLRIGDMEIECYVLEDGSRVLTQAGFLEAIGRHRKANVSYNRDRRVPAIIQGKNIAPFISEGTLERLQPIVFQTPHGTRAYAYRAEVLPVVCDIYLQAREQGVLPRNQEHVAKRAEILVRGLAHVGIIALVDEATGYQELRAKQALSKILEAFIEKELQPWVKTFPDDYYREIFRLRGMEYPADTVKRPMFFGHLTNDIVYKRLAPGVLDELKRVTPKTENGRPRGKYFQMLTTNIGYPKLREHLGSVVTIMKLSNGWKQFTYRLDQLHPRYGSTLALPLHDEEVDDGRGL